jgi:hypothetical protein
MEFSEGTAMGIGQAVTRGAKAKKEFVVTGRLYRTLFILTTLLPLLILSGCAGFVGGKSQLSQPASISISPTSLSFGKVAAGQKSSQSITLTNTGKTNVNVQQVAFSNPQFGISGATFPMTMGAGQSTTLSVWFTGTTSGNVSGTLTVQGDSGSTPVVANLSGTITTSTQPQISVTPASLGFGSVSIGSKGTANFVVGNSGASDLTVSMITLNGAEFGISGIATPKTISSGQSVPVTVTFTPTAAGAVPGSITLTSNDPNNPSATVSLTGTGSTASLGQLTTNPTSLSFSNVSVGSNASETIILKNSGTVAVHISSITAVENNFSVSGVTAPLTLTASQVAIFSVKFAPTATGNASGSISVVSDAAGSPLSIPVSGTATATPEGELTASAYSVNFGSVADGSYTSQKITLTNTGNAAVQIKSVSTTGTGFSSSGITAPVTLNPSQTATLSTKFAPVSSGSATGTITVANSAGSPVMISLAGTGTQSGLSISPATFNFGSVVEGQTKSQNFTLTNTGSASLTVTQISVAGADYSVSGLNTPTTIGVGKTAAFSLLFAPTTAGSLTGSVNISSDAPSSPNVVTFSGTGLVASVTISPSPSSLTFGNVNAGSTSSKSVTITNTGNSSVTLSRVTVTARDVSASGITMPMTLTPGQNTSLNLAFKPSANENITGNVTVLTTQGTNAVIPLTGSGVQAGLALTPSSVTFGNVPVGAPNSQTIQISNSGTAVLTISQLSVTGSGFSTISVGLPLSINPGASSRFNVQFAPQSAGNISGLVSLVSNAPSSPATLPLTGTGVAATAAISLSSTGLSFGNVNIGSSAQQSVTLTNTGNASVTISQINISGSGYTLGGAGTPVTLSPAQALTFTVQFSPSAAGTDIGSVSVLSNAAGSPASVSLSGIGVAAQSHSVALSWTASASTVSGYNVYRSTISGSGYSKLNALLVGSVNYTDSSVQNGQTYYYVTTAVDASGNESSYSNDAQAIIP